MDYNSKTSKTGIQGINIKYKKSQSHNKYDYTTSMKDYNHTTNTNIQQV